MALPAILIPMLAQLLGAAARTVGTNTLRTAATNVATQGVARGTLQRAVSSELALTKAAAKNLKTIPAGSTAGQRLASVAKKVGTFPKRHPIMTAVGVSGLGYAGASWTGHNQSIDAQIKQLQEVQTIAQQLVDDGMDPADAQAIAQNAVQSGQANTGTTGDAMFDTAYGSVGAGQAGLIDDPNMDLKIMADGTLFVNPEDGYRWTYSQASPNSDAILYKVSDVKALLDSTMAKGLNEWNNLKSQMFWGGFYDPELPPRLGDISGEAMQRDIDAINRMLYASNYQYDGMSWELVLEDRVMQSQSLGFPMYEDFESLSAEDLSRRPYVFYADPNDPYNLLKDWGQKNGVKLSDTFLQTNAERIDVGAITLDDVKGSVREKYIAPRFPAWQKEIMEGSDIDDLAMPYKETVARLLEKDINTISINDPLVLSGLTSMGQDGKPGTMPLYDFEKTVKQNEEWFKTSESKKEMDKVVNSVLAGFGFRR